MPQRITSERHEKRIESLRALIDSGSSCVVRDAVVGSTMLNKRRKFPAPSIGHRSGKLVVTGYIKGKQNGINALIVRCDCDNREYPVDAHNFKNFKSMRCDNCAKTAGHIKRYWKYSEAMPDNEHRRRLLNRLSAAIGRCHKDTNTFFKHYGERGIQVHPEWRADRTSFLKYVQTLDGWDNPVLEMDRTDVNGNYEPGNIGFVSRTQNMLNRRKISDLEEEVRRLRYIISRSEQPISSVNE